MSTADRTSSTGAALDGGPGDGVIEALFFDFDGLILDTESSEYHTLRDEFERQGIELPFEQWQAIIGSADHPHWMDWLEREVGRPLERRDEIRARRSASHHARVADEQIRPGVVELLDAAADAGIPCGVASSSSSSWVEGHLDRLGLLDRFAVVRTRDHVDRGKPWPDVYLAAAAALAVRPDRSVALEDSHNGSLGAKAAGMWCVVVPNDMTLGQDFSHVDLVVDSLSDLAIAALRALAAPPMRPSGSTTEMGTPRSDR
jgi:HAD superfamily hydrolase (TIGR01509 family)